ncbi:amidase [Tropicimonas sediminicola]|uniref:Amidase/6-aminohexanoate-cyclic-dimer hydrolase n=1 Tax=Tropicimonas sediminicola TaxID=1031541 RepID=A0A239K2A8_9RHOB|nr:amidase [Tropicimonas sediminicola]SNT12120.1 amidase/6-aminohexanoate-cyclic-dimer hydrolase [Tropicimonas sediminicola]
MLDYDAQDATALAALVERGEVSAGELLDIALERVQALNGEINAVVMLAEEVARRKIAEGLPEGPLRGVPFLLKDLGAEAVDYPCNNGSRLFAGTRYGQDSAIYARLAAMGLVVFGRTTAPEGGIGPATEAAVYGGPTRNPWDLSRTPGGSSGGAGAAVAAGIVPAAHGSDGGGSVRIPASNCGLFGLKATRARLPDGPYVGEGWAGMAIDGFLTRSVRDSAVLLDGTHGADLGAPYRAPPLRGTFRAAIEQAPGPLRIALCDTTFTGAPVHPECRRAVLDAAALLEEMGHHVVPARPVAADTAGMMRAWTDIVACGAALSVRKAVAARGRPLAEGEVEGVTRGAIAHAAQVTGDRYLECVNIVHAYGRSMEAFMLDHDILLSPTMAEPPAPIGRFGHGTEDYVGYRTGPEGVFAYSPFTAAFNASGQPAATVPLHWTEAGLPVGVHLAARFGEDERLMSLCAELERARPWFGRRPPLMRPVEAGS